MKYYKNTLIELQVRVGENRKIILAKRKLATTNHDSAPRPQRSRFAKPNFHIESTYSDLPNNCAANLIIFWEKTPTQPY